MSRTPPLVIPLRIAVPLLAISLGAQQPSIPPAAQQIAAAVLPLPADLRANATVMGYREANKLVVLRQGTNGMTCLALYVVRGNFHVACYSDSLEPFMARGRELRDQGVNAQQVDTVRFAEVANGRLRMPAMGTLYSLSAPKENFDAATNTLKGAAPLTVVYVPNATPSSLGISAVPTNNGPWLMFPGTPKAHIMITGTMAP
jgi:hypothetical protein